MLCFENLKKSWFSPHRAPRKHSQAQRYAPVLQGTHTILSTTVHCIFILPVAAFLVTRELYQERLALFCPLEQSDVFNDCTAPGIQSNLLEDSNLVF